MNRPVSPEPHTAESGDTGLPFLRTWGRVYLFVLGCYVVYVAALVALSRWFA